MSSYITAVNEIIVREVSRLPSAVLYGENIDTGSRISGLCRNLKPPEGGRIINVGNCENTHCGVGFGLMLNGAHAVLFAKQLDFMLLGMDHFLSTHNFVRLQETSGSFNIVVIVCDQGLQGPQSSFNALGDICSLARVDGFTITNNQDAKHVLANRLGQPGFRFIALSQRMFGTEFPTLDLVYAADDSSVFQYSDGDDVTIACCNFSLPDGIALQKRFRDRCLSPSLFSLNYVTDPAWDRIVKNVARTRRFVAIDDGKGLNSIGYKLSHEVTRCVPDSQSIVVTRGPDVDFGVAPDALAIDCESIVAQISGQSSNAN